MAEHRHEPVVDFDHNSQEHSADPVASYRNGLILIMGFFAVAGATAAALLTTRSVPPRTQIRAVSQPAPDNAPVPPATMQAGRTPTP